MSATKNAWATRSRKRTRIKRTTRHQYRRGSLFEMDACISGCVGPAMESKTFIPQCRRRRLVQDRRNSAERQRCRQGIEIGADRGTLAILSGHLPRTVYSSSPARTMTTRMSGGPFRCGMIVQIHAVSEKSRPSKRLTLDRVEKRQSCDDELKPEAMALIDDNNFRIAPSFLSDGMCDGGPLVFNR